MSGLSSRHHDPVHNVFSGKSIRRPAIDSMKSALVRRSLDAMIGNLTLRCGGNGNHKDLIDATSSNVAGSLLLCHPKSAADL